MLFDQAYVPTFIAIAAAASTAAAFVSLFTSITAMRALRMNQRAFEGKLLSDLMTEYASADMTDSMAKVSEVFGEPSKRPPDVDRRRVSHYFQKVYRLCKAGLITREMARTAIDAGQAGFFQKMKPIEDAIHKERGLPDVAGDEPFRFYDDLHKPAR